MKPNEAELNGQSLQGVQGHPLLSMLLTAVPVLLLLLGGVGCKQGGNAAAEVDPAGTYALVSVDGKNAPCTIEHEGHALAIKTGSFIINPDSTCSSKMVFSPPSGNETAVEVKATYTRQGSKLTMRWQSGGTTLGTVEGNTFTMNNEGMLLVYRR